MRLVTAEGASLIDSISQEEFSISGQKLMEEAGSEMAKKIKEKFPSELKRGVTIVVGPGNNGGDGRVIAKHLTNSGVAVKVLSPEEYLSATSGDQLLVDAIFGVGLSRNVEGVFAQAIQKMNASKCSIVAVDIPSGLNGTSGRPMGISVRADCTLMVTPLKTGAFLRDGPELCGKVIPIKVSFPAEVVDRIAREYFLMNKSVAQSWIPRRGAKFNKSQFGHAYIVAGSKGKWGAAVLATRAAFRAGAGYVVHSSTDKGQILSEAPEVMSVSFQKLVGDILGKKRVALAVGPGSGFDKDLLKLLKNIRGSSIPVVLDADALTLLSQHPMRLRPDWVMTPHSGELSRLLQVPVEEIESNPLAAAKSAWKKFGCTVVLKGLHTIVTSGYSGRSVIVPRGNVALAKAGTGDVLTGLIAGYLAQNLHPLKASLVAVYVHGMAADHWVRENSNTSMSASDLIEQIPKTLKRLENHT